MMNIVTVGIPLNLYKITKHILSQTHFL